MNHLEQFLLEIGTANPITYRHRLAGTITVDDIPARRNVFVCDRRSLAYVAATTSDPTTGAWAITKLPEYPVGSLIVLALDDAGTYNAEVADYVSQVVTEV
jgi:hypothetical protein